MSKLIADVVLNEVLMYTLSVVDKAFHVAVFVQKELQSMVCDPLLSMLYGAPCYKGARIFHMRVMVGEVSLFVMNGKTSKPFVDGQNPMGTRKV